MKRERRVVVFSAEMKPLIALAALLLVVAACGSKEPANTDSDAIDPVIEVDVTEQGTDATTDGSETAVTEADPDDTTVEDPLPNLGPVKPLRDLDGWLQSDIDSLEDLRGKVVVVQFWTFGCHNCKATLPNLRALYDRHRGEDFEIVGIHSPEFDYEQEPDAIAAAASELGVTWPIALDTRKRTFFGWQGGPAYWPRTFVLDREGNIRFDHIGEGAYEELNAAVATLLG